MLVSLDQLEDLIGLMIRQPGATQGISQELLNSYRNALAYSVQGRYQVLASIWQSAPTELRSAAVEASPIFDYSSNYPEVADPEQIYSYPEDHIIFSDYTPPGNTYLNDQGLIAGRAGDAPRSSRNFAVPRTETNPSTLRDPSRPEIPDPPKVRGDILPRPPRVEGPPAAEQRQAFDSNEEGKAILRAGSLEDEQRSALRELQREELAEAVANINAQIGIAAEQYQNALRELDFGTALTGLQGTLSSSNGNIDSGVRRARRGLAVTQAGFDRRQLEVNYRDQLRSLNRQRSQLQRQYRAEELEALISGAAEDNGFDVFTGDFAE